MLRNSGSLLKVCFYFRVRSQNLLRSCRGICTSVARRHNVNVDAPAKRSFQDFLPKTAPVVGENSKPRSAPYLPSDALSGTGRKVYFETYGCQMNVSDTEIARAVLRNVGYDDAKTVEDADVVLVVTCAIREGAEEKIWQRLEQLKLRKLARAKKGAKHAMRIGILGCMAERLKEKILEKQPHVDLIAGPDSYRDLPRMLSVTEDSQTAINVLLSLDETYADITPLRVDPNAVTAYVSIMRGCENMCTYCIVPFTRGRERSRAIDSILDEVRKLVDQGVKEVTLLGQNVNSYRDLSESVHFGLPDKSTPTSYAPGFKSVYKPKVGGRRFADLLDKVSQVDPELRIRFTSPHPKDFPIELLQLIRDRHNICKQIHLPAQSGNTEVLEAMGRGYTRSSYLDLVHRIRETLPDVSLTSDFIAGFCGETEEAHDDTKSLIRLVKYSYCYTFAYSMREKTRAYRRFTDDVPLETKTRRSNELQSVFRETALQLNQSQIGSLQVVLVEKESKRSSDDLVGRCHGHTKVIFPKRALQGRVPEKGDYVTVKIDSCSSEVLKGQPVQITTLQEALRDIAMPSVSRFDTSERDTRCVVASQ